MPPEPRGRVFRYHAMLVELIRSDLNSGEWFLRTRDGEEMFLVELAPIWAAKVQGRSGWFQVVRDAARFRIIRYVAGLAVDNGPVPERKRRPARFQKSV